MRTSGCIVHWAVCAAIMIVVAGVDFVRPAAAQVTTASVSGLVTDATGAVLADAAVAIKDLGTNSTRTVRANASGLYQVSNLPVGQYEISVQAPGFATATKSGIVLTVGAASVQNFTLALGAITQQITVTSDELVQLETANSQLGALVDERQMRELPLNGRNFEQLILLAPGMQPGQTQQQTSFYGRAFGYSNSGWRPDGEAILLDGADTVNYWGHGTGASVLGTSLGVEAIAEFQALTGTYSAEFGGAGLVINSVSKSGTNNLHGSVYEFLRNDKLDARSFFDGATAPPFRRNQFGVALGGPVKQDKTFFFGNYEGLRQQLGLTGITTVPNAAARNGDLPGQAHVNVSTPIQQVLALYPLPNGVDYGNGTGQYSTVGKNPVNEDYWLARVDHKIGNKDSLFGRVSRDAGTYVDPFPENTRGGFLTTWPETDHTANIVATIEERRIATTNLVNVARYSYVRTNQNSTTPTTGSVLDVFPGRPDTIIGVTGIGAIGGHPLAPFYYIQNKHTLEDQVYWTHGSHDIRFGGSIQRQLNNIRIASYGSGFWNFLSLASLLSNAPASMQGPMPGHFNPRMTTGEYDFAFYLQDNWKVKPNLTVNMGIRYTPTTNPAPRDSTVFRTILDPATSTDFTTLDHALPSNQNLKLVDPRFGFAYSPFGSTKTVLRGGIAMFHELMAIRQWNGNFYSPPNYQFVVQSKGAVMPACAAFPNGGTMPAPVFPTPFVGMPDDYHCLPISTTTGQEMTTKIPTNLQWNVNVERQIRSGLVLNVGYVGSHGTHLWSYRDKNPVIQQGTADNGVGVMSPYFPSVNNRVNSHLGVFGLNSGIGISKYHSLQASLRGNLAHNLQVQLYYTWSKMMSTNDNSNIGESSNGSNWQVNPYDPSYDYGISSYNVPHNLTGNIIYELPFKKNEWVRGFQVSLIMGLHSGPPYNATIGYDAGHVGTPNPAERPNIIADPNVGGIVAASPYSQCHLLVGQSSGGVVGVAPATVNIPAHWFNPCAFSAPTPGTLGNLGRNSLVGPAYQNFDLSLSKTTSVLRGSERLKVQFRAEVFNLLNHANFKLPSSLNVFTGTAAGVFTGFVGNGGTITTTANPGRQTQFGLKFLF